MQSISRRTLLQHAVTMAAMAPLLISAHASGKASEKLHNPMPGIGPEPFTLPGGTSLQPGPTGIDFRVVIRQAQTQGRLSCVEAAMAPMQMGPAPHYHDELDELMYVTEGTVSVLIDGQLHEVPAGGWNFRPRKLEHTFFNRTAKPARFIDMYFNQNLEDYLEELVHKIFPEMRQKGLTPFSPGIRERIAELDKKFGITNHFEKRAEVAKTYQLNM